MHNNMNYIIKMMSGEKFIVSRSEYEAIMIAEKGIFVPRLEIFINKSFIAVAYPESSEKEIEKPKELKSGFLHDGTRVRNHFGKWIVAESTDDFPVSPDPEYYPEIKQGLIFEESEYQKIKQLPTSEKLKLLLGKQEEKRTLGTTQGFEKLLN